MLAEASQRRTGSCHKEYPDTVSIPELVKEETMADFNNYQNRMTRSGAQAGADIDQGLRSYMLKVYNLMAMGLAITGVAAYLTFSLAVSHNELTGFGQALY